jgi:hypothetical protein
LETPFPRVQPLPLASIDQHVEAMHNTLANWFHAHADLTSQQLPFELFWGWLELTDALEQLMDARDRIDAVAAGTARPWGQLSEVN